MVLELLWTYDPSPARRECRLKGSPNLGDYIFARGQIYAERGSNSHICQIWVKNQSIPKEIPSGVLSPITFFRLPFVIIRIIWYFQKSSRMHCVGLFLHILLPNRASNKEIKVDCALMVLSDVSRYYRHALVSLHLASNLITCIPFYSIGWDRIGYNFAKRVSHSKVIFCDYERTHNSEIAEASILHDENSLWYGNLL